MFLIAASPNLFSSNLQIYIYIYMNPIKPESTPPKESNNLNAGYNISI